MKYRGCDRRTPDTRQRLSSQGRKEAESQGGATTQVLLVSRGASRVKLVEAECRASDLPPAVFRSDRHEDTQSFSLHTRRPTTLHYTPLSEAATACPPAPLVVPDEELLLLDLPGSSEDLVHVDFVSKLSLPVLQQDSLSEQIHITAEEPATFWVVLPTSFSPAVPDR